VEPGAAEVRRLWAALAIVLACAGPAKALDNVLVKGYEQGFWIRLGPTSAASAVLYGQTSSLGDYIIAQWDNPTNLGNFAAIACPASQTACYSAWSPDLWAEQRREAGRLIVRLGERGNNMPCSPAAGAELDAFVNALDTQNYPSYPPATLSRVGLSTLSKLVLNFTVTPISGDLMPGAPASNCGASVTKAKLLASVTLNNTPSSQTLFYQLGILKFNTADSPGFFANVQPFGYRDDMRNFGGSGAGISPFLTQTFSLDILPQLKSVITNAANGMDTNVANWTTGSVYFGSNLFGGMQVISEWSNLSMVGVP
jgi:hypothetical protein